jgi:hypothetical protein
MRSRDTSHAARAAQREAQRRLGPAGRVILAFEMSEQARAISIEGAMAREPGLELEEASARVLRRLLGDDLFDACWPTSANQIRDVPVRNTDDAEDALGERRG